VERKKLAAHMPCGLRIALNLMASEPNCETVRQRGSLYLRGMSSENFANSLDDRGDQFGVHASPHFPSSNPIAKGIYICTEMRKQGKFLPRVRLMVDMPSELHRRFKAQCALSGTTMSKEILRLIMAAQAQQKSGVDESAAP
jgi:hypothetical protein